MTSHDEDTSGAAGADLLHEWERHLSDLLGSLAAAGNSVLPRQLVDPMRRQLELTRSVVERERRLQQQLAEQLVAPVDAIFDLLHDSATTLRRQAEALQAAGRALDETAGLMKLQAERFEETVETLRTPLDLAKRAAGVPDRPR
jgi:ABC-type transporter Mla subunit MlaD